MIRPPIEAVIDLDAFGANVTHLRATVGPARLMVVVKADAYGHGRVPITREAVRRGIRDIGALDLESAIALRESGLADDVAILAWLHQPGADFAAGIRAHIDLGVSSPAELEAIATASARLAQTEGHAFVAPRLHLKLDTGLHRNGATAEVWPQLVTAAVDAERAGLVRVHAAWTHIAEASEEEDTLALERFLAGVAVARELGADIRLRHLAASSAGLRRANVRLDLVRMGGHCWGIPSFDGVTPADIGLVPVMTLHAQVLGVRTTETGSASLYVGAGYGDGLPRRLAGRVAVAVRGVRFAVVAVERDHLELTASKDDVRALGIATGDDAVLFGTGAEGEQTVRQWGDLTGTLGDEITTRIAARVPRRYIGGSV